MKNNPAITQFRSKNLEEASGVRTTVQFFHSSSSIRVIERVNGADRPQNDSGFLTKPSAEFNALYNLYLSAPEQWEVL